MEPQELLDALKKLGWTHKKLGMRMGVHQNTVSRWCLRGGCPISVGAHLRLLLDLRRIAGEVQGR